MEKRGQDRDPVEAFSINEYADARIKRVAAMLDHVQAGCGQFPRATRQRGAIYFQVLLKDLISSFNTRGWVRNVAHHVS